VLTNQEACDTVRALLLEEGEGDLGAVADKLLALCYEKGSTDNMTCIVVTFPAANYGKGAGEGEVRVPLSEQTETEMEVQPKAEPERCR